MRIPIYLWSGDLVRSWTSLYSGFAFTHYIAWTEVRKHLICMHHISGYAWVNKAYQSWAKSHIRCSYHMNYIMWLNHTVKAVRLLILVLAEPVNTWYICWIIWFICYVHMNAGYLINRLYSIGLWTRIGVKPWMIN